MILLSRKTDYALLILAHLHQHSSGCARTIAERFDLSRGFVANILKELTQKGFVTSSRGVKGGYVLREPLESVTLASLVEATEDGFQLTSCSSIHPAGNDGCSLEKACPIRGPIGELHRRMMDMFRTIMLADLLQPGLPIVTLQPKLERITAKVG